MPARSLLRGLLAAAVTLTAVPVSATAGDLLVRVAAGRSPELALRNAHGELSVSARGRRGFALSWDGRAVPVERIDRDGDVVTVRDEAGEPVYRFSFGPAGRRRWAQLAWSPNLDPATTASRHGFSPARATETLHEIDQLLLRADGSALEARLRSSPERVLLVDHVVDGGPADQAGLRTGDLLVAVAGSEAASEVGLHRAAQRLAPGEPLRLTVLRGGRELEIPVATGEPASLPAPEALSRELRDALRGRS